MIRAQLWTFALIGAFLCSIGWIVLPGECVVQPLGTSSAILATLHWRRKFDKLRAPTAFYALILSAAVAFYPYRTFSDVELIAIVGIWGIVVMVAYQSKASPGSALLSLMAIQLLMSEIYSGLGPDRGLPFWVLT